MKCFDHQDRDAIGICKSCQKGLCPDCAADLSQGLACKVRCEDDVQNLIQLIRNNIKLSPASFHMIKTARRNGMLGGSLLLIVGALFVAWGISEGISFSIPLGACFALFGLISLTRALLITAPAFHSKAGPDAATDRAPYGD